MRDDLIERKGIPIHELHFERVIEEVLGRFGRVTTISALVFTQMGFSTAYVIFIASNLNKIYPSISFTVFALMMGPALILLCWIRELKWITPVALAGMVAIGLAVGVVLYFCFVQLGNGIPEGAFLRAPWGSLPIAFGVNVYLFEGIGLILPLESKMENPKSFVGIMWGVHLFVATLVSAFGLVGYLAFYNCTEGPIIRNLPATGPLIAVTVWGLNVCLLFTYPIQMVPVFQILEDFFLQPSLDKVRASCCGRRARCLEYGACGSRHCLASLRPRTRFLIKAMLLRALVVVVSVGFAISIPYFDLFLSLIGGLGSAQLMFILPPIAYLACFWRSVSTPLKIACFVLLIFGIGTLVVTTVFTVISIVSEFVHSGDNTTVCNITYFLNQTEL